MDAQQAPPPAGASPVPETVIEARRGRLGAQLAELVRFRELLLFLAWNSLKIQYAQTSLGFAWLLLRPMLQVAALTLIFGHIARMPSDGMPYPLFVLAALLPWLYFSTVTGKGASSLQANKALLTKVYFPRMYLPFSQLLVGLADLAATFVIFLALGGLWYGRWPGAELLWLPVPLLLLLLTTGGACLWLSALSVSFPDVRQMVGQVLQLLMFAAPVIWPLSVLPDRLGLGPEALAWYALYPMVGVVEGFRHALLGTPRLPWELLGPGFASAGVVFATGLLYFRRHEREFADLV